MSSWISVRFPFTLLSISKCLLELYICIQSLPSCNHFTAVLFLLHEKAHTVPKLVDLTKAGTAICTNPYVYIYIYIDCSTGICSDCWIPQNMHRCDSNQTCYIQLEFHLDPCAMYDAHKFSQGRRGSAKRAAEFEQRLFQSHYIKSSLTALLIELWSRGKIPAVLVQKMPRQLKVI